MAAEITKIGGIAVCAPIAPYAATRADVRAMVQPGGEFVLVHIVTQQIILHLESEGYVGAEG